MELSEAVERAKRWAAVARRREKSARDGGYDFMASDNGKEAEVLETLIEAIEERKDTLASKECFRC